MPFTVLILIAAATLSAPAEPADRVVRDEPTAEGVQWMEDNFPVPCWPDLTHDDVLDFFDVLKFLRSVTARIRLGDWNKDGVWDHADLAAFLTDYAKGCPPKSHPRADPEHLPEQGDK
tara:strand:+ start:1605 stop:1958 length:354 start_codon:yes stop_codon:yes gene_type:complete